MSGYFNKENAGRLSVLAGLAVLTYLLTLAQPFISDDYPSIRLALTYGPVSGWDELARDTTHRVRAITVTFPYAIHSLFGLRPVAFYSASVLLHVLNCWLLFAAGRWPAVGYKVSFWAAAFFAVYEGHAEAIMWFSGCSELLMFFFGFISFLFWLIFLEKETARFRWLALSFLFFVPALFSKESSIIFIALFALPLLFPKLRLKQAPYLLPHIMISVVYVAVVFMSRSESFRFQDQSFVLSAPFWVTWTKSYGAMLWFWGLSAAIFMILWREIGRIFLLSLLWIGIGFVPYMFVDYMHRIPSRQIYLASAGLALLMGAAIVIMKERYGKNHKWIVTSVLLAVLLHNVVYTWTKKREHFLGRAEPTEQLISVARNADGPIFVKCFPLAPIHAEAALEIVLNKPAGALIWSEEEARKQPRVTTFCYEPAER